MPTGRYRILGLGFKIWTEELVTASQQTSHILAEAGRSWIAPKDSRRPLMCRLQSNPGFGLALVRPVPFYVRPT
jgi:hypothetical protein